MLQFITSRDAKELEENYPFIYDQIDQKRENHREQPQLYIEDYYKNKFEDEEESEQYEIEYIVEENYI